jgi:DNA-binding transcriptional LysR family regulator
LTRDLHRINLNLLAALDALLTERHVGRAAQHVGVTQSAMSHSLRQLRELLDDPLLVRAGRRMLPTPRAEAIAPLLQDGLRSFERALRPPAVPEPATFTDTFTVAAPDVVAGILLALVFGRLRSEAPLASLAIVPLSADIGEALERGRVHVALLPPFATPAGLLSASLPEQGWLVVGREDHPALQGELDLDTYCALPHIMATLTGVGLSFLDDLLARHGRSRRVVLRVPFQLAVPAALVTSDAVITVPVPIAEHYRLVWPVRAVPVPRPLQLPPSDLLLGWHERYDADPAQRWFRELVLEVALAL